MPKNSVADWDTTAANNTDMGGISILGGADVKNFDNAFREMMAQIKTYSGTLDGKVVYAAKAGNYTALAADNNAVLRFTAAATLSLTAAATLAANWHVMVIADGGDVTIDANGSETINGATTMVVYSGQSAFIVCSGTAFFASKSGEPLTTTASQSLSGQSAVEFALPTGTRVARIVFSGLSSTGTVVPQAQIGTASAFATSGYSGSVNSVGSSQVPVNATIGVPLAGEVVAATTLQGTIEFTNLTGNTWVATGLAGASNSALTVLVSATVTLADTATRVRLNLTSTTFDAGTASVICM